MIVDRDWHIHTKLSKCARLEATVHSYLEAARSQGLKSVGFSNHCWAENIPGASEFYRGQGVEHVLSIKKELAEEKDSYLQIFVGCETEFLGGKILGLDKEHAKLFDFIWIPANHFHQKGFVVPENLGSGGPREVAELLYRRFLEAVELDFGTGIVHPLIPLGFKEQEEAILKCFTNWMYENCFRAASQAGIAIEINADTACNQTVPDAQGFSCLYTMMHTIARECGCKFFFGSDAHQPDLIRNYKRMAEFATHCGITETMLLELR
jgi:histidinol phosphatase-like PHP family hydrolase